MINPIYFFPEDDERYQGIEKNSMLFEIHFLQLIRTSVYADGFSIGIPDMNSFQKFKKQFFAVNSQSERDALIKVNISITLFSNFLEAVKNHLLDPDVIIRLGILTLIDSCSGNLRPETYNGIFFIKNNLVVVFNDSNLHYIIGLKLDEVQINSFMRTASLVLEKPILS